jgi:hypothetical protein
VKSSYILHNETPTLGNKKEQDLLPLWGFVLFPSDRVSHHAAQAFLENVFLLPQPPELWDNRCPPLHPCTMAKLSTKTVIRLFPLMSLLYKRILILALKSELLYTHIQTHTHTD